LGSFVARPRRVVNSSGFNVTTKNTRGRYPMLDIKLSGPSAGPVYLQVRQQLEALIGAKNLAPGDALPAPARLAQQLSVDRGEIQRAYFELEQSGLVKKAARKDFLSGREIVSYSVA
jgi:hypothetical protein